MLIRLNYLVKKYGNNKYVGDLDQKIIELRKQYKKMINNSRIRIDLCDNADKLGENREKDKYDMGNNCEPWISRECIFVLDSILPYNGVGLEWSSGSSTIWLSYRIRSLVSVENIKNWYEDVSKFLVKRKYNDRIKLLWFDKDNISYCNSDIKYITKYYGKKICLKTYATSSKIPNRKYDFISVDGRVRTGCFLRAVQLIKEENGIIIMDNAERERYQWVYKEIPMYWSKFDFWYKNGLVRMFVTHKIT